MKLSDESAKIRAFEAAYEPTRLILIINQENSEFESEFWKNNSMKTCDQWTVPKLLCHML